MHDPTKEIQQKEATFYVFFFIQDYLSLRCNMYEDKNLSVFILASPLLQYCFSDIQHISFCFFPLPSFFSSLLSAGLWISLQIGNMRVKKKKKTPSFSFCLVCVLSLCQFINPADPPEMAAGGHTCHYCREQSSPLTVQSCLLPSPLFLPHFIPAEQ